MRPCIEPCEALRKGLNLQLSGLQKLLIDSGDLQLAASRRFDPLGDLDHLVRIEIESHDGIVRLGFRGLLLDRKTVAVPVELGHAVTFGVLDPISEYRRLSPLGHTDGLSKHLGESRSVKDIVAQHQTGCVVTDKLLADNKRLRKTVGRRLLGILQMYAVVRTVTQQPLESRQILRGGDHQNIPDSGQHQHGNRVVNHRFVVDRQQLLADPFGNRIPANTIPFISI